LLFANFSTGREFSRYLAWKLLTGGLFLLGLGLLIVMFPELLAIPVSLLCFMGATFLFVGAWKVFWASRRMEQPPREYEEVTYYEVDE
jgi:membrane protein implicated in regulation of membrane protease activity